MAPTPAQVPEGSVDALLVACPLLLAEHELLHLPRGSLGQIPELHRRRTLEVRQPLAAEDQNLFFGRALTGPDGHERLGTLTPDLIGDGDHRTLQNSGMLSNRLLDLNG